MKTLSLALLFASGLFGLAPSHAQTTAKALPPTQSVNGLTQAQWAGAWWQWAGSFERRESPLSDQTGALCGLKQSGPVWFLAGTYGAHRAVRTCKVPQGKYLFFPLVNSLMTPRDDIPVDCEYVRKGAASMMEDASSLVLEVDGVRTPNLLTHRQATQQCFDMGARTEAKTPVFPSAGDGYYVMLKPLSRGKHEISFGGAVTRMVQAVTYTLEVE